MKLSSDDLLFKLSFTICDLKTVIYFLKDDKCDKNFPCVCSCVIKFRKECPVKLLSDRMNFKFCKLLISEKAQLCLQDVLRRDRGKGSEGDIKRHQKV